MSGLAPLERSDALGHDRDWGGGACRWRLIGSHCTARRGGASCSEGRSLVMKPAEMQRLQMKASDLALASLTCTHWQWNQTLQTSQASILSESKRVHPCTQNLSATQSACQDWIKGLRLERRRAREGENEGGEEATFDEQAARDLPRSRLHVRLVIVDELHQLGRLDDLRAKPLLPLRAPPAEEEQLTRELCSWRLVPSIAFSGAGWLGLLGELPPESVRG